MPTVRLAALRDETGAVLAESVIVFGVVTLLTIGLVEFGSLLWQRNQVHVGVRDAARYMARCPMSTPSFDSWCSQDIAKNIALFGSREFGAPRVWNWTDPDNIAILPAVLTRETELVVVTGTFEYSGSPLFGALGLPAITMEYTHQQRYIGW